MEKFSHSSPWPRIFVEDPSDITTFFSYEGEVGLPRVIITKTPKVQIQDFGDHVNIEPFVWKSKEQFDQLAIEAVMKAHEIAGKTFRRLDECAYYLSEEIKCGPVCNVLISREDIDLPFWSTIEEQLGTYIYIASFKEIKKNHVYVLPSPEFFGVIAENRVDGIEQHAIAIMNPLAIAKVEFESQ